jgi:hypothetical protein
VSEIRSLFLLLYLVAHQRSRWVIRLSFQMGLSLKTDPMKLTATVLYLHILYMWAFALPQKVDQETQYLSNRLQF